jgi:hypothetical protein
MTTTQAEKKSESDSWVTFGTLIGENESEIVLATRIRQALINYYTDAMEGAPDHQRTETLLLLSYIVHANVWMRFVDEPGVMADHLLEMVAADVAQSDDPDLIHDLTRVCVEYGNKRNKDLQIAFD